MIGLMAIIYGVYLLKTAMGINVLNSYSAPSLFKVPLQPMWANQAQLCEQFQTLCIARSSLQHKIQYRINRIKDAIHAG
jgi:hypothetical protein